MTLFVSFHDFLCFAIFMDVDILAFLGFNFKTFRKNKIKTSTIRAFLKQSKTLTENLYYSSKKNFLNASIALNTILIVN